VANVISFIASSQASYMTGCDILVDGGVVLLDPARIAAEAQVAAKPPSQRRFHPTTPE
jgi:hypothetical protein